MASHIGRKILVGRSVRNVDSGARPLAKSGLLAAPNPTPQTHCQLLAGTYRSDNSEPADRRPTCIGLFRIGTHPRWELRYATP